MIQIDAALAPICTLSDSYLTTLIASTYPLEVIEAARFDSAASNSSERL